MDDARSFKLSGRAADLLMLLLLLVTCPSRISNSFNYNVSASHPPLPIPTQKLEDNEMFPVPPYTPLLSPARAPAHPRTRAPALPQIQGTAEGGTPYMQTGNPSGGHPERGSSDCSNLHPGHTVPRPSRPGDNLQNRTGSGSRQQRQFV